LSEAYNFHHKLPRWKSKMKSGEITQEKLTSLAHRLRMQSSARVEPEGSALLTEVADILDSLAARDARRRSAGERLSTGLRAQKTFDYVNRAVREEFRAVERATASRA
jgi:hypothetical protein